MRKISPKHGENLFKLFLTLIMSFVMSLIITAANLGITPDFLAKWGIAFALGFATSFPAVLISVPLAKRAVKRVTEKA